MENVEIGDGEVRVTLPPVMKGTGGAEGAHAM